MKKQIVIAIIIVFGVIIALSLKARRLENPLPENVTADKILIEKSKRRLTLLNNNTPLKTYVISLGKEPVGKKTAEGDGRTPEGIYSIDRRKLNSKYHRALHISYPNSEDSAQAKARGVSPGGDIMIHGLPNGIGFVGKLHTKRDWTLGCIAVTNPEIEEILRVVPDGATVVIMH
jgi:murein L,D-transpeptidase YafK